MKWRISDTIKLISAQLGDGEGNIKEGVEYSLLGSSLTKGKMFQVDAGLWFKGKVAVKTSSQTSSKVA